MTPQLKYQKFPIKLKHFRSNQLIEMELSCLFLKMKKEAVSTSFLRLDSSAGSTRWDDPNVKMSRTQVGHLVGFRLLERSTMSPQTHEQTNPSPDRNSHYR